MLRKSLLTLPFIALLLLTALANATPTFAASKSESTTKLAQYKQVQACAQAAKGFARCLAIELKPTGIGPHPVPHTPNGLTPNNLQNAYKLPSATAGKGLTVAIVDAYDDPKAESDLATYRSTFGLPACTTANGCFKKVDQQGGTRYPQADSGWAGEISLDLDMVSAICPNCHILLVEANSSSFNDLGTSVNTAVRLGAVAVSNSYGGQEDSQSAKSVAPYYNHSGVVITASSGDSGYGVQLPAAFNTVIAVGGTSLRPANTSRGWTRSPM